MAPLGAGGMGEVYRARDAKLARDVAIKVLPADVSEDAERRRRFEQEARAASSLNHPSVVHVYDIGAADSVHYIAMELVEGRSLRQLLAAGPLPARRILDIAVEITDGLAKAHASGIVHRDLKPDNVLVSDDGHVKILDFGLAKVNPVPAAGATEQPTMSRVGTAAGLVLGTVGYMSPEQAAGLAVDHASDQFSLGVILYELASGRKPFEGATTAEALVSIIKQTPESLARLSPSLPAPLRWIVEDRLLAKEPRERYASTADLLRDLRSLRDHLSEASGVGGVASPIGHRRRGGWRVAVPLGLLLVGVSAFLAGRRAAKPAESPRFRQLTFSRGMVSAARFAPDGETVVYSATWEGRPFEPFLTRLGSPEARSLGLGGADLLAISSTGEMAVALDVRYIGGWQFAGTLARVALAGGSPRPVMENVQFADWSPDGKSLAIVREAEGKTRLEYPIGTLLYETAGWLSEPRISPDGTRVAFLEHPVPNDNAGFAVVVDRGRDKKILGGLWASSQGLAWSPSGREIWFSATESGNAMAIHAVKPEGGPDRRILAVPGALILQDISAKGRVLLVRGSFRNVAFSVTPGSEKEQDLSALDWSIPMDLSADGKTVLISEQGEGAPRDYAVYLRHTDTGSPAVVLGEGAAQALSPDGRWALAFAASEGGDMIMLPTGAGEARRLPATGLEYKGWAGFLPDGQSIVCVASEKGRGLRLYVRPIGAGPVRAFSPEGVRVPFAVQPLSPDGKQIAALDPSGQPTLYPVDGAASRAIPGAERGDMPARFTGDGQSIYVFRVGELPARIFKIDLATGQRKPWKEIAPGDRAGLTYGIRNLLPTPDGRSYVYSLRRVISELYAAEGLH